MAPDMSDAQKAFRVGLVQMCAGRDVGKNIATATELIREAARGRRGVCADARDDQHHGA